MTPDGLVRLVLKKPFRDGTAAIEMTPLALLSRLAVAVPPPRRHVVGYHGVLSSSARLRPLVVPPLPPPAAAGAPPAPATRAGARDGQALAPPDKPPPPPAHRCRYRPVLELMARTFGDDLAACARCGGRLRLVGLVKDRLSIDRFLRGIGEPTDFPPLSPARGPPYFIPPGTRSAAAAFAPEPLDESA